MGAWVFVSWGGMAEKHWRSYSVQCRSGRPRVIREVKIAFESARPSLQPFASSPVAFEDKHAAPQTCKDLVRVDPPRRRALGVLLA